VVHHPGAQTFAAWPLVSRRRSPLLLALLLVLFALFIGQSALITAASCRSARRKAGTGRYLPRRATAIVFGVAFGNLLCTAFLSAV